MVSNDGKFPIEVVFALPDTQVLQRIEVSAGCTVEQAVTHSGILGQFPEIDLHKNKLGIFGQPVKPDTLVQANDRIEIYRPLIIDPKEARRIRAKR